MSEELGADIWDAGVRLCDGHDKEGQDGGPECRPWHHTPFSPASAATDSVLWDKSLPFSKSQTSSQ